MPMTYMTPGVYVEEVSTGPRPIEAVGTSTAGFVGVTPDSNANRNEALAVNNWSEFVREFAPKGSASTPLSHAVWGFFQNGGSRCYIVNVGKDQPISGGGGGRKGLDLLEEIDEIAIVAAPGYSDAGSYDALLSHCEKLKDRFAILDAPSDVRTIDSLTKVATVTAAPKKVKSKGEGGEGGSISETPGDAGQGARPRTSDGGYGAVYYPWITVRDVFSSQNDVVNVPPSGHMAGIYGRSDASRGVHKAPANEVIRGALGVSYRLTHEEQGVLNPSGVNCIRLFARDGIRVWGGRTVADSSSEWKYVNVRRLFNMIEESIAQSTRWVVFEPNDRALWKSIRRDVGAFLTRVWRDGALMGRTPEEAFFVKCDDETNTPENIDAGQVVILIGVAPVKPAEFVIFRIGQSASGAEIESQ